MTELLAAYEAIDLMQPEPLMRAKARGLMHGYHARWKDTRFQILGVEEFVTGPLINPETNHPSRTFTLGGIIDARLLDGIDRIVMDHKTTSEEIEDPSSPYWKQLIVESQPSFYMLLEWMNGRKIDYAIWDVIRKPQISPRQVTKAEQSDRNRVYFGRQFDELPSRETFDMYEARVAWDCTHERPDRYFARRRFPRTDADMIEFVGEQWMHAEELRIARAANRHPRNSGACMVYGSPCKFLGICSGYDSPDSEKWTRKEQVHNELPIIKGDGRDVLTNSRIRSFQTCRKRHYFEYEFGIDRVDAEEKDSLVFGTLMHKALAAWFETRKEQSNVHNDSGSSIIGIESATALVAD